MSSAVLDAGLGQAFARAHADIDDLLDTSLLSADQVDLLEAWRELERLRNRLAAVEHRFVTEAESRGLPFEHGCRDVGALLRGLLRVAPGEARARVRAADAAAHRVGVSGESLAAPFVAVAEAQASGVISPEHARVIVRAVDTLPDAVQADHGGRLERELVGYASQFDPHELAKLAAREAAWLDPDGALADVDYRRRQRDLTVSQRADGSATIRGEATAELAERLLTMLDAVAAPKPAEDGVKDPRRPGQRHHDALLDVLELAARAGCLPDTGGVATTVLLTTTEAAWQTGTGFATTGHGAVLPTAEARRIAGGDARVTTIHTSESGAIVGWRDARRLFTASQRLALSARDRGCSFPGCDTPPAWCQAHHVLDHARGGPTTVANGTLLCGFHHREHQRMGWRCQMRDGHPAWIPPPHVDPDQRPRSNRMHRRE